MGNGVEALAREVAEKVDRIRSLLAESSENEFVATFGAGVELDSAAILDEYCRTMDFSIEQGWVSSGNRAEWPALVVPEALTALYRITNAATAGYVGLFDKFCKGDIMDPDGEVHRSEEHWLQVGLIGNDQFSVSLMSGEVMFADQYFWRYGEQDSSRIVAPDMLTFFDEYMIGPKYREFLVDDEAERPGSWFRFLLDYGFA
ncbi:hypothetical protein [Nocardia lasii]|uniref:SMI1/KNR4 family protein n=1 Tax=Nocardia lasii TaxID=1616107 RepID=A0ABW1JMP4_9NOCA